MQHSCILSHVAANIEKQFTPTTCGKRRSAWLPATAQLDSSAVLRPEWPERSSRWSTEDSDSLLRVAAGFERALQQQTLCVVWLVREWAASVLPVDNRKAAHKQMRASLRNCAHVGALARPERRRPDESRHTHTRATPVAGISLSGDSSCS